MDVSQRVLSLATILTVRDAAEFPRSPAALLDVSNLVTYFSIAAGIGAIIAATVYGSASLTGMAIACTVLADTFDGRYARLFARDSARRAFGVQLDSLTDAVNSAVVPVVALSALVVRPSNALVTVWWCCAAAYVVAAVTRLGFYNLFSGSAFVGLPTPVPALLVASVLIAPPSPASAALLLIGCAVAMVAPIRLARPTGLGLGAFAAWTVGVILWHLAILLAR